MYQLIDSIEEYRMHLAICRKPLNAAMDTLRKEFEIKGSLQPLGNKKIALMLKDRKGTYYVDYLMILTRTRILFKEPQKVRSLIDTTIQNYCKARGDDIHKKRVANLRYTFTTAQGENFVLNVEILHRNQGNVGFVRLLYNKENKSYGWWSMPGRCGDITTRLHRVQKYNQIDTLRKKYVKMKNMNLKAGEEQLSLPILKQACVETMHLVKRKQFLNTSK